MPILPQGFKIDDFLAGIYWKSLPRNRYCVRLDLRYFTKRYDLQYKVNAVNSIFKQKNSRFEASGSTI